MAFGIILIRSIQVSIVKSIEKIYFRFNPFRLDRISEQILHELHETYVILIMKASVLIVIEFNSKEH